MSAATKFLIHADTSYVSANRHGESSFSDLASTRVNPVKPPEQAQNISRDFPIEEQAHRLSSLHDESSALFALKQKFEALKKIAEPYTAALQPTAPMAVMDQLIKTDVVLNGMKAMLNGELPHLPRLPELVAHIRQEGRAAIESFREVTGHISHVPQEPIRVADDTYQALKQLTEPDALEQVAAYALIFGGKKGKGSSGDVQVGMTSKKKTTEDSKSSKKASEQKVSADKINEVEAWQEISKGQSKQMLDAVSNLQPTEFSKFLKIFGEFDQSTQKSVMAFEQLERKLKGVLSQQDLSDLIGRLERLAETAYLHGSSKAEAIQNATQKFPGALRALPELTGPSLKRDQDLLNSIANAKEEAYGLLAQSLLKGLKK